MRLLPSFGRGRIRRAPSVPQAPSDPPGPSEPTSRVLASARPAYRGSRVRSARLPVGYQSREAIDDGVPRWLRRAAGISWRILAVVALVVLFVYAMAKIQLVFIAVFLSLVVASVLRPVVNTYAKVMPRGLATAAAILSGLVVVGGLITYVVVSVTGQWEGLVQQFSSGIGDLTTSLQNLLSRFGLPHDQLQRWTSPDQLDQWRQEALQWFEQNQSNVISSAASSAGSIVEVFATLALSTFVTIFFLARGAEMWHWFINQLPARVRPGWILGAEAGWYTFSGYARGTVIIALSDGILAAILLSIVGVPLALPLAVLVFIGAFIPLVGAPAAMIIAAIVALAANGWVSAIIVTIGIALIGQFEGHVLQPLVMGRQVSLHPVVVAVAVTAGTLVAGILGAVIVIPLVAVVWAVYSALHDKDQPVPDEEFTRARETMRQRKVAGREHD
ncbi:AI-2E family transporter [Pseudactinotalea sp. HY160]|uniref:AI-2E family transporter n=1 Tax=Pseudactinotalea sp. HY160 TaxID=2654490 RepID=UPI00128D550E|nr:AI-2E family transporter [Pseudactinotalea sp. HY160]MPV49874.1 AI-2E family transporter [Pseudactinotalea sp. HY160]